MRTFLAAILVAPFIAALAAPAKEDASSVSHSLSGYTEAWSTHDLERIAGYFTEDAVYEDVALGEVHRGKSAIKKFAESTFAALPGFAIQQRSLVVGDGSATMEWIMTGTDRATERRFSVRGVSIMELEGGKIRRNSDYWNMADFQRQTRPTSASGS